jgi:hypothetical protein
VRDEEERFGDEGLRIGGRMRRRSIRGSGRAGSCV